MNNLIEISAVDVTKLIKKYIDFELLQEVNKTDRSGIIQRTYLYNQNIIDEEINQYRFNLDMMFECITVKNQTQRYLKNISLDHINVEVKDFNSKLNTEFDSIEIIKHIKDHIEIVLLELK